MQPAEGVRFVHSAIDTDVRALEAEAFAAETDAQLDAYAARFSLFHAIAKTHNDGEEVSLFPELDRRLPRVAATYLFDHEDEAALFDAITGQVAAARGASPVTRPSELAKLRRHAVALTEHVTAHVRKENTLITPLVMELFTPPEQAAHVQAMIGTFSPELLAKALPWIVANNVFDERCAYVGMMQRVMPPERFPVACGWIKAGIGDAAWSAIAAKVPGLPV
ncbi:MAG: hemerythrin domain-containing protein [Myxococcales bacterium]|nr:hemerythrin domain-containing protein [Myxococcales bacterium]